jgi:DNA-binding transcriptional MerR regulator
VLGGDTLTTRLQTADSQSKDSIGRAPRKARLALGADLDASSDSDDPMGGERPGASVIAQALAAQRRRRGGGGSSAGSSRSSSGEGGLLTDQEVEALEAKYADGISAVQVIDIFVSRGVRFSEATFRKYVQQGLLPRSRRVGRKGKHRGSMGVYPAKTVRRINELKRLMADGYTIEEIQEQFLRYTDLIETLDEGISEFFSRLDDEVAGPQFDKQARRNLERELGEARRVADELMRRLDGLSRRVAAPRGERSRSTGAAGSAEDLL